MIALTAVAVTAPALALTVPTAAHATPHTMTAKPTAAPAGPVDALRQQFAKKGSVRISEDSRMEFAGDVGLRSRVAGTVRFGKSGPDAIDLKVTSKAGKTVNRMQVITVGGKTYLKSPLYDDMLPAGRSWVRTTGDLSSTSGTIDILQPKVLKAVLAHTTSKAPGGTIGGARTVLLRGSIKLSDLAKVSPSVAPLAKGLRNKKTISLPWKLWIGADQLPRRFQSTFSLSGGDFLGDMSVATDTRFTAWGAKVVIKAPPADLVVDEKDLTEELPVLPDFTTKIPGLASRER
ncbi:hypothetical protein DQ384_33110 [Sphaerisporangium album]|uniref:DUF2993 domain-containing protein n=1 Tax=Sphaerisporangium album TaxID=509200 RepID=A0A367F2D4_9ACTN|nr:hypothetical protein DQ384_33110 [Sphaerisporangium album]